MCSVRTIRDFAYSLRVRGFKNYRSEVAITFVRERARGESSVLRFYTLLTDSSWWTDPCTLPTTTISIFHPRCSDIVWNAKNVFVRHRFWVSSARIFSKTEKKFSTNARTRLIRVFFLYGNWIQNPSERIDRKSSFTLYRVGSAASRANLSKFRCVIHWQCGTMQN